MTFIVIIIANIIVVIVIISIIIFTIIIIVYTALQIMDSFRSFWVQANLVSCFGLMFYFFWMGNMEIQVSSSWATNYFFTIPMLQSTLWSEFLLWPERKNTRCGLKWANNFHEQFFVVCNIFQSHHIFKMFNCFVLPKKGKCWWPKTQCFLTPVKVTNQLHLDLPALTKHFSPKFFSRAVAAIIKSAFGRNFHYSSSSVKEYF